MEIPALTREIGDASIELAELLRAKYLPQVPPEERGLLEFNLSATPGRVAYYKSFLKALFNIYYLAKLFIADFTPEIEAKMQILSRLTEIQLPQLTSEEAQELSTINDSVAQVASRFNLLTEATVLKLRDGELSISELIPSDFVCPAQWLTISSPAMAEQLIFDNLSIYSVITDACGSSVATKIEQ